MKCFTEVSVEVKFDVISQESVREDAKATVRTHPSKRGKLWVFKISPNKLGASEGFRIFPQKEGDH